MKELSLLNEGLIELSRSAQGFQKKEDELTNEDKLGLGKIFRQRAELFFVHGFLHYALTDARNSQKLLQEAGAAEEAALSRSTETAILARLGKGAT